MGTFTAIHKRTGDERVVEYRICSATGLTTYTLDGQVTKVSAVCKALAGYRAAGSGERALGALEQQIRRVKARWKYGPPRQRRGVPGKLVGRMSYGNSSGD